MKKYFLKLYEYNAWANRRVIECLSRQSVNDEKILRLMGHVLVAELVWLHRVKNLPPPDLKLWGDYELKQLGSMSEQADKEWLEFVVDTDDVSREITYKSFAGDPFTN